MAFHDHFQLRSLLTAAVVHALDGFPLRGQANVNELLYIDSVTGIGAAACVTVAVINANEERVPTQLTACAKI